MNWRYKRIQIKQYTARNRAYKSYLDSVRVWTNPDLTTEQTADSWKLFSVTLNSRQQQSSTSSSVCVEHSALTRLKDELVLYSVCLWWLELSGCLTTLQVL